MGLLASWANGTAMARRSFPMPTGASSTGELAPRFDCVAMAFAYGAGDGNRTRTVSLGTNLIWRIHRGGPLD